MKTRTTLLVALCSASVFAMPVTAQQSGMDGMSGMDGN